MCPGCFTELRILETLIIRVVSRAPCRSRGVFSPFSVIKSLKYWCQILFPASSPSQLRARAWFFRGFFFADVKIFLGSDEKCVECCPDEIRVGMWQSEVYSDIKTSWDGSYFHGLSRPYLCLYIATRKQNCHNACPNAFFRESLLLFLLHIPNDLIIAERNNKRLVKLCHCHTDKNTQLDRK